MSFENLTLKPVYTTGRNNLLKEFYIPFISKSITYDRAAGYFSSHIFSKISEGLSAFFSSNQGKMRLIIGGDLSEEDADTINEAALNKKLSDQTNLLLEDSLNRMVSEIDLKRLDLLSLLIKTGRLEIRFVYKKIGMFHDKFGLFYDCDNSTVLFQGSSNETAAGYIHNVESITCFKCSSFEKNEHIEHFKDLFESLWTGNEPNCITLQIPDAIKSKLLNYSIKEELLTTESEIALANIEEDDEFPLIGSDGPKLPSMYKGHEYRVRNHQTDALYQWKSNNFSGIAELCTGSGKTVMAIHSIVKIYEANKRLLTVISVPYINLAEQWVEELKHFNIDPIRCYSGNDYERKLSEALSRYRLGSISFSCIVVVNATFVRNDFYKKFNDIDNLYYIADECHHLRNFCKNEDFSISAQYKLGLSATPFHYFDDYGNSKLCAFFNCRQPFYSYKLKNALEDGVLAHYNYYPILVELTSEESEKYTKLTKDIAVAMQSENEGNTFLENLIRKRTELIATAENKLIKLKNLDALNKRTPLTLFYCGIDSYSSSESEDRQIDALTKILYAKKWNTAQYTSKENTSTRKNILNSFRTGSIDALIAMKCLDEGVDIPGCHNAFILASSRDPRQFIQRRGRVLRKAPGKEYANIYDFIVIPPTLNEIAGQQDLKLVKSEFERAIEFADLAINSGEAKLTLLPIAQRYGLVDLL